MPPRMFPNRSNCTYEFFRTLTVENCLGEHYKVIPVTDPVKSPRDPINLLKTRRLQKIDGNLTWPRFLLLQLRISPHPVPFMEIPQSKAAAGRSSALPRSQEQAEAVLITSQFTVISS